MELRVLIERLPHGDRYTARLGEPFNLRVEAATADEAQDRLIDALRRRLQRGAELRLIAVRPAAPAGPTGGRLPPDDLTQQEAGDACANGNARTDGEPPVADFLEPVYYDWTETGYEARRALKRYSEQTHADP